MPSPFRCPHWDAMARLPLGVGASVRFAGEVPDAELASWYARSDVYAMPSRGEGFGLVFAGATDTCAMGMLLARLPYNKSALSCDSESMVRRFIAGNNGAAQ